MDDNGNDQGSLMRGSVAAALVSATAFTAARVYCSTIVLNRTRREDVVIVLSLLLLWAGCILTILAVDSGMGKHAETLTADQKATARLYYLVSVWPALLAITVPKIAVAGLIIRIFTPDVWTRTIMSVVVCVGVANYIVISALSTFQCQPLAASWDARVPAVRCVSAEIYLDLCYFTSTYSASVDCYLAIYPALVFRKMGFSIIKKIGLSLVLGLGIGATAVACLKISYLHALANEDFTWTTPRLTIWTIIEATVTIVAACIPVLHPLYDRARAAFSRLMPGIDPPPQHRGQYNPGRHGHGPQEIHCEGDGDGDYGDSAHPGAGFWSLKLRAIRLAESWWSSTTGGRTSTNSATVTARRWSRRSQAGDDGGGQQRSSVLETAATVAGEGGGQVLVLSESPGREERDVGRAVGLPVTVSVDEVYELSHIERGRQGAVADIERGPDPDGGERTTVIGQK